MKSSAVLLCGLLAFPAFAQENPPNGYDQLVAAGKLILPGENGTPSTPDTNLTPTENLRRQRVAVARNAPALAAVREALRQPITLPLSQGFLDLNEPPYAKFRELARQLQQESDVRAANGDWAGALDSHLTSIELGAGITRGASLIGMLVGVAIETIGRHDLDKVIPHLDAPTLDAAVERFKSIDARRGTFTDVTEVEKQGAIKSVLAMFKDDNAVKEMKVKLATPEGRREMGISDAYAAEIMALTPESMTTEISAAYDPVIARDRLPYQEAQKVVLAPVQGAIAKMLFSSDVFAGSRLVYERNLTENRLLESALELRRLKLEKGAYPTEFDAGVDPFGKNTKLIYQRDGGGYSLYSVGPDGKDDGGEEIQTLETNGETGVKTVTGTVRSTSTGDISAPIF